MRTSDKPRRHARRTTSRRCTRRISLHRAAAALAAAFLFFAAFRTGAQQSASAAELATAAEAADAYLRQAHVFVASGARSSALQYIASALALFPRYSEALYLRALVDMPDQQTTRQAAQDLRDAISSGSWARTDPYAARQALAGILVRTGQVAEARTMLQDLIKERPDDDVNLVLLCRLYRGTGDDASEEKTLAQGRSRFPKTAEFTIRLVESLDRTGRSDEARALAASSLRELPDSLALLLQAARLEPEPARRLAAVARYVQKGGTDPLAAVVGLEALRLLPSAQAQDAAGQLALFLKNGGLSFAQLTFRAALAVAGYPEVSSQLNSELSGFTGVRDLDADSNGFFEERSMYQLGRLTSWTQDSNQDGVPEFVAYFEEGVISSLSYEAGTDARVSLTYGRYPFIESASETTGSVARLYMLVPQTLSCPYVGSEPLGVPAPAASGSRFQLPSRNEILTSAYRIAERAPGTATLLRDIQSSQGKPVFMEEDTDGDGVLDHKVWYAEGSPVRGTRDLTGDGGFEVVETWREGALWRQEVDTNGNGKPDYSEQFGAQPSKSWDYNEDGKADSREYPGDDRSVVREFSTSLNGPFDLRVVFRDSMIVQVQQAGRNLQATGDQGRGVVWIGAVGKDSSVSSILPDGIRAIGGREYLVFRFAGVVYVEELR